MELMVAMELMVSMEIIGRDDGVIDKNIFCF